MAAELEEVVVDPDAFEAEHVGPDRRERLLGGGARGAIAHVPSRLAGLGQRGAIELAVRRHRKRSSATNATGTM